jgi:hypothetical protein
MDTLTSGEPIMKTPVVGEMCFRHDHDLLVTKRAGCTGVGVQVNVHKRVRRNVHKSRGRR